MKAGSARELKINPSAALREARDDESLLSEPGIRRAVATALYRDESLSLGQAARFSGLSIGEFIRYVSRLGIPVVRGTADTVREDAEAVDAWRNGSS